MNDKQTQIDLTQRLEQSGHKLVEFIEQSGSISIEETPLVIQEFLAWHFWGSIVFAAVYLFLFFVTLIGLLLCVRGFNRSPMYAGESYVLGIIVCSISLVVCFMSAIINIMTMIQVVLAPRLYLLQELPKLFQ